MALMATTGVTPWRRTMARCASRLAAPSWTSSGFSSSIAGGSGRPATTRCRPECSFIALTVVTTTAASGTRPDVRHLMLKKRSAPMSAPNPASVMRNSPAWIPIRSATTDEFPCAMLPKGPAWTSTGVFSRVWSRLGLMASRMMTVIAPAAFSCSAVTGSPAAVYPTTIRPMRRRRSRSDVESASTAMTSEAAVMSNPVSRGVPSCFVPSPPTM